MIEHDPRYDFSNQAPVYWNTTHAINMTLRDYFAGQVLSGYFANNHKNELKELGLFDTDFYEEIATHVYEMADAMLEARKCDTESLTTKAM